MIEDAQEEFMWVIGLAILGFVVNLVIRWNRIRRIRETYDDGGEGYIERLPPGAQAGREVFLYGKAESVVIAATPPSPP